MRLTLNKEEYDVLQQLIENVHDCSTTLFDENKKTMLAGISRRITSNATKPVSLKKKNATKEATLKRIKEAKNKISNAVNMMRFENKKITISSIALEAGVSYNTVKKYKESINEVAKCV